MEGTSTVRSKGNPFKPFTIARSMLEPKYRANEADLFTHLPYVAAVTDTVISTRDGELIGTLLVKGIPVDTTEDRDLEIQATAFAKAIDGVEGTASFYVNKINTYAGADFQPAAGDDFAAHIDAVWCNSFQGEALINHYSLVTVGVRETATDTLINRFRDDGATIEKSRAKLVDALNQILDNLETLFRKAGVERLTISSGKLFGYLSSINTAEYHPIKPTNNGMPVAAQLAEHDILFKLTEFQTRGILEAENTVGAILSMNKYAAPTEVGIYDGFFIPHKLVVTHSYIPVPLNVAMAKTTILYNQMNAAKSVTTTDQEHLKDGADRLGSGQLSFGLHHCTVAIHAANRDDLAKVISHIKNTAHFNGGSVRRDYGKAMCSMFFAQHPANQSYRTRFELANNHQFADMVAFHNQPSGRTENLIWGKPLTHFKTATDSLYAFNLHEPQTDPKHFPVGHTLILGRTGTGKSVLAMFLAAQAQRLGTVRRHIKWDIRAV